MNTDLYRLDQPLLPRPEAPLLPKLTTQRPDDAQLAEHTARIAQYKADMAEFAKRKEKWDAHQAERRHRQDELTKRFWHDARAELGYGSHPMMAKLEAWADEHGHATGLDGIWEWLCHGWELLNSQPK